jgi:hypothetical protein
LQRASIGITETVDGRGRIVLGMRLGSAWSELIIDVVFIAHTLNDAFDPYSC